MRHASLACALFFSVLTFLLIGCSNEKSAQTPPANPPPPPAQNPQTGQPATPGGQMVPSGQSVPPSGVVPAGQGGDPDTQNGGYCDGDWCYEYDNGDGSSYYGDDTDYSDNSGFSENGDSGWSNDGWYYYPNDFYLDSRLNSLQQYGSSGSTKLKIRARARR